MKIHQGLDFGEQDFISVMQIVNEYFHGLYHGDIKRLRKIFHHDAYLKAPSLRRSLEEWLMAVEQRASPESLAQDLKFRLLSIEIIKDQGVVKLECPLFEHAYVDFLGLLKENGQWLIVNKMYTDLN